jgi:uncharacterized membrane protein YeaQ/YmgE (transglycosylase-associated protein family)
MLTSIDLSWELKMNMIVWGVAGALLGWASFTYLSYSEGRGMVASLIVGAVGGLMGGHLLAPIMGAAATVPDSFSLLALIVALGSAAALLFVGGKIHERFGF